MIKATCVSILSAMLFFTLCVPSVSVADESSDPAASGDKTAGGGVEEFETGARYLSGEVGGERNYEEGVKWMRRAANAGHSGAMLVMGHAYKVGMGMDQDYEKAAQWYRSAAKAGQAEAQFELGMAYHEGLGVQNDMDTAIEWFKRAAMQGSVHAQYNLGHIYNDLDPYDPEAMKWFRMAADQGDASAQHYICFLYRYGYGGASKDRAKAREWCLLAANNGNKEAEDMLKFLPE